MNDQEAEVIVREELRKVIRGDMQEAYSNDELLVDIGVDSIGLISVLVALEKRLGLDIESAIGQQPPRTYAALVHVVKQVSV